MTVMNLTKVEESKAPPEKITRTNVFKGEFSPTGVMSAACLRKFYYTKILGLKVKDTPSALAFGSAIHAGVEHFYANREKATSKEQLTIDCMKAFGDVWSKAGIMGDSKRNLDTGIITMNNYVDYYYDDLSKFSLEDIETEQWVAMPNGTMLLIKMDRVMRQREVVTLVDTKTTSMAITPYFWKGFENQLQVTLYHYGLEQVLGQCDQIMIDAIKVPPPPENSVTAGFGRNVFLRTDLQVSDAIDSYCNVTDIIMNALAKPEEEWASRFCCDTSHCNDYGGCSFMPICKFGLDHPSVRVDFEITEPLGLAEFRAERAKEIE